MGRKWQNIKYKKGAADAQRGKVLTKHAKLIAVAARHGSEIESNATLKAAVENARAEKVPLENIERAIKKGSGEGKDAAVYEEIVYEGFGPGSVAMLVEVLTDNRNRALGNLRTTMGKKGGRMAENGAVAWMFKKIGEIILTVQHDKAEELELMAIDMGADDFEISEIEGETLVKIVCGPQNLGKIRHELEEKGYKIESSKMTYDGSTKVDLAEDSKEFQELETLIEAIEEDDDVNEVYTNLA